MTPIERLAPALQRAWDGRSTLPPIDFTPDEAVHLAHALLAELREPTPEMVEAAIDCGPVGCCILGENEAREIWKAMIDAIDPSARTALAAIEGVMS